MKKEQFLHKGITLIALIVTVIILLILASVVMSIAINQGDLFGKSKGSVDQYNQATAREKTELDRLLEMVNNKQNGIITVSDQNSIDSEMLNALVTEVVALKSKVTELEAGAGDDDIEVDKIYPVGSVYISVSETNPGELFGGTWESFGTGRTLVGVNTEDGNFDEIEKTGGSEVKILAVENLPSHTHSIPTLSGSAASAGGHTHTLTPSGTVSSSFSGTQRSTTSNGEHTHKIITTATSAAQTYSEAVSHSGGLVATGEATVVVGTYYRHPISNGMYNDGGHSHTYTPAGTVSSTFSGSQGTTSSNGSHTHSVTTNASTTGANGSGNAFSILNPYITVYMWKRTS